MKIERAEELKNKTEKYYKRQIMREIFELKRSIKETMKSGKTILQKSWADEKRCNKIYNRIAPDLILKGYVVDIYQYGGFHGVRISWGVRQNDRQIEENLEKFYMWVKDHQDL